MLVSSQRRLHSIRVFHRRRIKEEPMSGQWVEQLDPFPRSKRSAPFPDGRPPVEASQLFDELPFRAAVNNHQYLFSLDSNESSPSLTHRGSFREIRMRSG